MQTERKRGKDGGQRGEQLLKIPPWSAAHLGLPTAAKHLDFSSEQSWSMWIRDYQRGKNSQLRWNQVEDGWIWSQSNGLRHFYCRRLNTQRLVQAWNSATRGSIHIVLSAWKSGKEGESRGQLEGDREGETKGGVYRWRCKRCFHKTFRFSYSSKIRNVLKCWLCSPLSLLPHVLACPCP